METFFNFFKTKSANKINRTFEYKNVGTINMNDKNVSYHRTIYKSDNKHAQLVDKIMQNGGNANFKELIELLKLRH